MPPEPSTLPPQPRPRPALAPALPPPIPMPAGAVPVGAGMPVDDFEPAPVSGGFWQQPWVQNVLPLVTSLALHATVILIGVLFFKVVQKAVNTPPVQEQIIIPESAMADASSTPGGVENPGLGGDPTRAAAQDEFPDTPAEGFAPKPGENNISEMMGGGSGDSSDPVIGTGPGGGFSRGKGSGTGTGDATGSGSGTGNGKLAPFGAPGGGGAIGPKGKVFGSGGNALTIAFVCDASGSMLTKMDPLKRELTKAVDGLKPIQSFSIIFFADEKFIGFENGGMVAATSENKQKVFKWLEDVTTSGTTNPIPGLEMAFRGKPHLLYLLTDGDFPDNAAVTNKIKALNPNHPTRINTIAFVNKADVGASQSFIDLLTKIAEQNGGQFRKVDESEL